MSKLEISTKINKFLNKSDPFIEEKDVIYFIVEVRKILEHLRNEDITICPTLKFYCDWAIHTKKDYITQEIKNIFDSVDIKGTVTKELNDFFSMNQLKSDLEKFFQNTNINNKTTQEFDIWNSFRKILIQILSDQPINFKKEDGIIRFAFKLTHPENVSIEYDFIP